MTFAHDSKGYQLRGTRYFVEVGARKVFRTVRIAIGGSGAACLYGDRMWQRDLLRLVKSHDRGRISPQVVADYLARINYRAHLSTPDKTVGPRCIVAWRYREGGRLKRNSGHQFYTGLSKDSETASLPWIMNGADIHALVSTMWAHTPELMDKVRAGESVASLYEAMNAELAQLPETPDEKLR
jgi:hypothetical protein